MVTRGSLGNQDLKKRDTKLRSCMLSYANRSYMSNEKQTTNVRRYRPIHLMIKILPSSKTKTSWYAPSQPLCPETPLRQLGSPPTNDRTTHSHESNLEKDRRKNIWHIGKNQLNPQSNFNCYLELTETRQVTITQTLWPQADPRRNTDRTQAREAWVQVWPGTISFIIETLKRFKNTELLNLWVRWMWKRKHKKSRQNQTKMVGGGRPRWQGHTGVYEVSEKSQGLGEVYVCIIFYFL